MKSQALTLLFVLGFPVLMLAQNPALPSATDSQVLWEFDTGG